MTDITPKFGELLSKHNARLAERAQTTDKLDSYLQEASRINKHIAVLHKRLRDVRQAYLATAKAPYRARQSSRPSSTNMQSITDREREEVDVAAKRSIRELTAGVRALDEAEQLRRDTERALIQKTHGRRLGALGTWAMGGLSAIAAAADSGKTVQHMEAEAKARETAAHRDGVLLFLRKRLEECCRTQQEMMEKRIAREMEKSRSNLSTTGGTPFGGAVGMGPTYGAGQPHARKAEARAHEDLGAFAQSYGLTAEQVQVFEKGSQDMMRRMESEMDKIRTAQTSLVEIAELQNTLVTNLSTQQDQIDLLMTDQQSAEANVKGGNEQLKKATRRPRAAKYTFFAAGGLCAFLIVWDLII